MAYGDNFGEREMHKATCADCGNECEVPFKPTEGRPVYCKVCVSLPAAYLLAILTLVSVADQHCHAPLLVSVAAIPSLVSVGPLLWFLDAAKTRRLE